MANLIDALRSLHTALVDSKHGYEEALQDAGEGGMTDHFRRMIAMRQRHAVELSNSLRGSGVEPDEDGSFMSTVHRTVMSFQSLFGDLDERIIPGLVDGEKRIVASYDDALAAGQSAGGTHGTTAIATILQSQRTEVLETISELEQRAALAN